MTPAISIICPVYNAQNFIKKCLNSIAQQTFNDWELILVDDGSPDDSGVICDEYAAKDERIKVIHKKNGGVSSARQAGLEASSGEYVIHVDPDDWIEPTMLEELFAKAKEEEADVVICDYFVNDGETESYKAQKPTSLEAAQILKDLFLQLHGSCCNKLVSRACYNTYNIRFPENINYCEDLLTWVQLFKHDDVKTAYLPKAFYHYWMNENSISHRLTRKNFEGLQRYLAMLDIILIGDEYKQLRDNAALGVFIESFIGGVMTNEEIFDMFCKVRATAYSSSMGLRWKLGCIMIDLRLYHIAHIFIKY